MKLTLEQFAEAHNLDIQIQQRKRPIGAHDRYYANFARVEIQRGNLLASTFGNGATPAKAVKAYAEEISGQLLVINAYGDRKEIQVPQLRLHGGPRKNSGRKPLGLKRLVANCKPKTVKRIKGEAKAAKITAGAVIDRKFGV